MNLLVPKQQNHRIIIGIILLLLLLLGHSPILIAVFHVKDHTEATFVVSRIDYWLILGICFLYCIKIEKQDLLLWKDKGYPVWMYPVFMISIFLIQMTVLFLMGIILYVFDLLKPSPQFANVLKFMDANMFLIFLTSITAGVVEELIFRGYLQPRLEHLFKKSWIAILITSILFGLLHLGYGTVANVMGTFLISLVFCVFYHKYRSIKTLIVYHALYDVLIISLQLWKMHNQQQIQ
jgi:membrane protease YdiL (CAAX protease family)